MGIASNSAFTLGESKHYTEGVCLLLTNTIDLSIERNTLECWTSTFTSTLHIWRFSYYQWQHTHFSGRILRVSTLSMLEDLFVMRTAVFHLPSLIHYSYSSHSNHPWRRNQMILHHKQVIQVAVKWDEGGLLIIQRREVKLEKEILLHSSKHPAPISTLSREGKSIHHILASFSLSTLSTWQPLKHWLSSFSLPNRRVFSWSHSIHYSLPIFPLSSRKDVYITQLLLPITTSFNAGQFEMMNSPSFPHKELLPIWMDWMEKWFSHLKEVTLGKEKEGQVKDWRLGKWDRSMDVMVLQLVSWVSQAISTREGERESE